MSFLRAEWRKLAIANYAIEKDQNTSIDFTELASLISSQKTEYRKRFVIHSNDSFFHLPVTDIALFYSTQGITFAVTFEKREYPVNFSLENLKDQLQPDNFFKINRQFIVNIDAIKRVHSYFNGKLKLEIEPSYAEDIVVGKDKAGAFKRWMDR